LLSKVSEVEVFLSGRDVENFVSGTLVNTVLFLLKINNCFVAVERLEVWNRGAVARSF
jgi:hypothetical protein